MQYRFSLGCADSALLARVEHLLGPWVEAAAWGTADYELVVSPSSAGEPWYSLVRDGSELAVGPDATAVLTHLVSEISAAALDTPGNRLVVHAGAVSTPAGAGVVLPGRSGSGKTTLVAGLVQAGFGYLSDEAAVVDPDSGVLHPFARPLGLKGAARRWFGEGASANGPPAVLHLTSDDLRVGSLAAPCPVGHVIAPRYEPAASTELTRMTPAEVVVELGECAMNLLGFGQLGLHLLADLARRVQGHRLVSGDLVEAVSAVRELTSPA